MFIQALRCKSLAATSHAQIRTFACSSLRLHASVRSPIARKVPLNALPRLTTQGMIEERISMIRRLPSRLRKTEKASSNAEEDRLTRMVVYNVPTDMEFTQLEERLAECFGKFGEVNALAIGADGSSLDGHAYVEYYLPSGAQEAMQASKSPGVFIDDNKLRLKYAPISLEAIIESPCLRLWVQRGDLELDEVRRVFGRYGEVKAWSGRNRNVAFVQYSSAEESARALKAHRKTPFIIDNCLLDARFTAVRDGESRRLYSREQRDSPSQLNSELFMSRLGGFIVEDDIRSIFGRFGEIQSIDIEEHRSTPGGQLIFVRFATTDQATAVLEAWKDRDIPDVSPRAFMNYSQRRADAFHRLCVRDFPYDEETMFEHLREFTPFVWRVAFDQKRAGMVYIHFDTNENAAAACIALQDKLGRVGARVTPINSTATFDPASDPRLAAFANSFPSEDDREMAVRLFKDIWNRTKWTTDYLLPHYLGDNWLDTYGGSSDRLTEQILKRRKRALAQNSPPTKLQSLAWSAG